jgi:hypothetical protein
VVNFDETATQYSRILSSKFFFRATNVVKQNRVALGGLVVIVFATGPEVRWFKPGRGRQIFKSDKNL